MAAGSSMVDGCGRSVAAPLRKGSSYCLFHAVPFSTKPACLTGPVVVIYLDLETTGVDVSRDRVVEIAATQSFDSAHMPGACYAEVTYVPEEILRTPGAQAAARVHGIPDSEIAQGAAFPVSWARFLAFSEAVLNYAIHEASDSSEEDKPPLPRPLDDPPSLLVAAHNGHRFDFAVLLFECHRHRLPMTPFRRWFFVDTLHVLASAKVELGGACLKLQCLANTAIDTGELCAHRALDDTIALRQVVHNAASRLGCSVIDLLRPFSVQWDEQASTAQVAALIEE